MTRTLITGAAGFTGRYVSTVLAQRGHDVYGLVHGDVREPFPGISAVYEADLADIPAVKRIVQEVRPDHVVHLAAIAFIAHGDVERMYRTNVVGTRQLLEAIADLGQAPRSIILASSANIYGNSHEGILVESLPPAPVNDYGVSKVAMEYVATLFRDRLPLIVVRPFNYTGRGQGSEFLVPKIVAHARERRGVIELGNVEVARDFSDVRTVAEAYARLLEAPEAVGETFNLCSGRAVSLQGILDTVGRLSGHHLEVQVNPAFVRANEVRTLCGSPAKLERIIGPLPAIPLEATLSWMLEE